MNKALQILVSSFIKNTGRKPNNLEMILLKQKLMNQAIDERKIVSMIDRSPVNPNKPIMGGKNIEETEDQIRQRFMKRNKEGIESLKKKMEDPENKADGGRIGLKDGLLPIKKDGFFRSIDFSKMTPEEIELYKLQMEMMKKGFEKKLSPEGLEKLKIQQQIRDQQRKDRGLPEEVQLMADGGRIGYAGGSDMGTVADSKGNVGPSKGGYQGGGTGPVERPTGGGGDNSTNYDYTIPKQIAKTVATNTGKTYLKNKAIEKLGLGSIFGMAPQVAAILGVINSVRNPQVNEEDMQFAKGGRAGYKKGSIDLARRGFLKAAAGVGAGIGALKMGALKLFGKEGAKQVTKNIIKTDAIPGKPEWFDSLVTKVINEGTDVTKKFATQEREIVHKLDIDKFEDVTVYRNLDTGEIRVSYESPTNVGEQSVDLVYKKPLPDEGDPRPSAEFYAVEPEPRVVNMDGDMEFDGENLVNSVDELMSDTNKLKILARGDNKPNLKEFVTSKKKKDAAKKLNEDGVEQAEYIENKYGPAPDEDPNVFASGGIARLLGE